MDKLGWIVVSNNTKLSGRRGKRSRSSAEHLPWASAWYLRRNHGSLAHSQEQFLESIQSLNSLHKITAVAFSYWLLAFGQNKTNGNSTATAKNWQNQNHRHFAGRC